MKSAKRTIPYPPTCPPKPWRRWKCQNRRIVFSFIDIMAYSKVGKNLARGGVTAREFKCDEMCEVAEGIGSSIACAYMPKRLQGGE